MKELFEPIVLCSFNFVFVFSFSTNLLVMLGDLTVENANFVNGNLYLIENRFRRNKMWKQNVGCSGYLFTIINASHVQK